LVCIQHFTWGQLIVFNKRFDFPNETVRFALYVMFMESHSLASFVGYLAKNYLVSLLELSDSGSGRFEQ